MKPWAQVVRCMTSVINPRKSVLGKEPRTEQEPRKYQEKDKDQGLERGSRSQS